MSWEAVEANQMIELSRLLPEDTMVADANTIVWLNQYSGFLALALRLGVLDHSQQFSIHSVAKVKNLDTGETGDIITEVMSHDAIPLKVFFNTEKTGVEEHYITQHGEDWLGFEPIIEAHVREVVPNFLVVSNHCVMSCPVIFTNLVSMLQFEAKIQKLKQKYEV